MPRLRYSDAAKEDLKEIARFIASDKPNAAREWVAKLRERCREIAENPEVGDACGHLGEAIRSVYLGRCIIFFRRNEATVEIVRIRPGDLENPYS